MCLGSPALFACLGRVAILFFRALPQETVDPADLDRIAANVRAHMDALTAPADQRPAGSPFRSALRHADHENALLVCRLWDLASAYRQLARAPRHASFTVIACWSPEERTYRYFQQPALAFGASSSVLSFNWTAAALCAVLVNIFVIGVTNFYDDFTVLEVESLASNAKWCIEGAFGLLGWSLKELPDFSTTAEPLGAVLDLAQCRQGRAHLANRPKRVEELVATINELAAGMPIPSGLLQRLRGRLLFSRSLCFGRFGGNALRALSEACACEPTVATVSRELAHALRELKTFLQLAPPREIRLAHDGCPVLLTDGSFEPGADGQPTGGMGGVVLDPADKSYLHFSVEERNGARGEDCDLSAGDRPSSDSAHALALPASPAIPFFVHR